MKSKRSSKVFVAAILLTIISGGLVLYMYFRFNVKQSYTSPDEKYLLEIGWRMSSPGDYMDRLYRLKNNDSNTIVWEQNYEDGDAKDIFWHNDKLYLYIEGGGFVSRVAYDLLSAKKTRLDSSSWQVVKEAAN